MSINPGYRMKETVKYQGMTAEKGQNVTALEERIDHVKKTHRVRVAWESEFPDHPYAIWVDAEKLSRLRG